MTKSGQSQHAWTNKDLATVRAGIRNGLTRQEIAAALPLRTYGAVGDKILVERRRMGISVARAHARRVSTPELKADAKGFGPTPAELEWAGRCREASQKLHDAIELYQAKQRQMLAKAA